MKYSIIRRGLNKN